MTKSLNRRRERMKIDENEQDPLERRDTVNYNVDPFEREKVYKPIIDPIADELAIEIRLGNKDLFPFLFDRCDPLLKKAAFKHYITGYDKDDLYQEACMVLHKAIHTFDYDKGMSFHQYTSLCLANHFQKLIRHHNTMKRKPILDTLSLEDMMEENGYQLEGIYEPLHTDDVPIIKETFQDYILFLSDFERDICFYFAKGYTTETIAQLLNCSKAQVKSGKQRCTDKFKKFFY